MMEQTSLTANRGRRFRQKTYQERCLVASLFAFFMGMMIINDRTMVTPYLNSAIEIYAFQEITRRKLHESSDFSVSKGERVNLKCSPWDVNIDNWWQAHPDWEPSHENETHTCFQPIPDPRKAAFFREVYETQYHGKDCSHIKTRHNIGAGYAAAIGYIADGFWSAFRHGDPFQATKYQSEFRWIYNPPYNFTEGAIQQSWAACPSQYLFCYFLPISNCEAISGRKEDPPDKKYCKWELRDHPTRQEQHIWLKSYLTRPRQETRRRLWQLMQKEAPVLDPPCTWIHVRRGDATKEALVHPRNFYSLSEYLKRGNISKGETVLLLTDDEAAIDEADLLHSEYNWVYWNRTRNRGSVKRNSHIPSKDEALELLIILAELQLAGKCKKGVHGTSNLVHLFKAAMVMEHGMDNIEMIQIDAELKKVKMDEKVFMKELEEKLESARKARELDEKLAAVDDAIGEVNKKLDVTRKEKQQARDEQRTGFMDALMQLLDLGRSNATVQEDLGVFQLDKKLDEKTATVEDDLGEVNGAKGNHDILGNHGITPCKNTICL